MPSFDDFKRGSFLPGAAFRQKQREEKARNAVNPPNTAAPTAAWANILAARVALAESDKGYAEDKGPEEGTNKPITELARLIYPIIADLDFSLEGDDLLTAFKQKIQDSGSQELIDLCDVTGGTKDGILKNLLAGVNELKQCNSRDIQKHSDENFNNASIRTVNKVAQSKAKEREESEAASKVVFASEPFPVDDLNKHGFDFAKTIANTHGAELSSGAKDHTSFTLTEKGGKNAKLLEVNITADTNPAQAGTHCIATYTLYNPIKNQKLCKEIASTTNMEVKAFSDAKAIAAVIRANGQDLNFSVDAERRLRDLASDHLKSWMGTMDKADYNTINDFLTEKYGKGVGSGNPADEHSNVTVGPRRG